MAQSASHLRRYSEIMCGIAGFSLAEGTNRVDAARVARALLIGIEPRGRDATGIAWATGDDVWFQKQDVKASLLVDALAPDGARALIAHTRYATQGSPTKSVNNHPLVVNGVVGVHNGQLDNDDEIFDMLDCQRDGQVDSEAAFALLGFGPTVWEGASAPDLLALVEGTAALAWMVVGDAPGTLHLARLSCSPLVVATTMRGSLLFASTEDALRKASTAGGFTIRRVTYVPEGTYLRVEHGKVVHVEAIKLPDRRRKSYAYHDLHSATKTVSVDSFADDDDCWQPTADDKRLLARFGNEHDYSWYHGGAIARAAAERNAKQQQTHKRRKHTKRQTPKTADKRWEPFPDFDPKVSSR